MAAPASVPVTMLSGFLGAGAARMLNYRLFCLDRPVLLFALDSLHVRALHQQQRANTAAHTCTFLRIHVHVYIVSWCMGLVMAARQRLTSEAWYRFR